MLLKLNKNRGGFTLVEIMIVVAIIALLAAIAVPNFLRARKRSQAVTIMEELRVIDGAQDLYYTENNKADLTVAWSDLMLYFKQGSRLYEAAEDGGGVCKDILGNNYVHDPNTHAPQISAATFNALSDAAPAEFWSPYGYEGGINGP